MDEDQDNHEIFKDADNLFLDDMELNHNIPAQDSSPYPPLDQLPLDAFGQPHQGNHTHNPSIGSSSYAPPHTPTNSRPQLTSPISGGNAPPPFDPFTSDASSLHPPFTSVYGSGHDINPSSLPSTQYSSSSPLSTFTRPNTNQDPATPSLPPRKRAREEEGTNLGQRLEAQAPVRVQRPLFREASGQGTLTAQLVARIARGYWRSLNPNIIPDENASYWFEKAFGTLEGFTDAVWPENNVISHTGGFGSLPPHEVMDTVGSLWQLKSPRDAPDRDVQMSLKNLFGIPSRTFEAWLIKTFHGDSAYGTSTQTTNTAMDELVAQRQGNTKHCCRKKTERCDGQGMNNRPRATRTDPCVYICTIGCGAICKTKDSWKSHEMKSWGQVLYICNEASCSGGAKAIRCWVYKEGLRSHNNTHHNGATGQLAQKEIPIHSNYRRDCVFLECEHVNESFMDHINHVGKHYEEGDWGNFHWRESLHGEHALHPGKCRCQCPSDPLAEHRKAVKVYDGQQGRSDQHGLLPDGADTSSLQEKSSGPGHGSASPHDQTGTVISGGHHGRHQGCLQFSSTLSQLKTESGKPQLSIWRTIPSGFSILEQYDVHLHQWSFISRLGSSKKAIIDEVRLNGHSKTMACKKSRPATLKVPFDFIREVKNMAKFDHPHIVGLFGTMMADNLIAILMQPAADYNLSQFISACSSSIVNEQRMLVWFSCLTSALQHIHANGVSHQDIKPNNLLIRNRDILFADFGSSCSISDNGSYLYTQSFTSLYAAPEVFKGRHGKQADVYSLGCVFYEMRTTLLSREAVTTLRSLQNICLGTDTVPSLWAIVWEQRLHQLDTGTLSKTDIRLLEVLCQEMTDPVSDRRPTAAQLEHRIASSSCPKCKFGPTLRNGKKAATFPPDRAKSRTFAASNSLIRVNRAVDSSHRPSDVEARPSAHGIRAYQAISAPQEPSFSVKRHDSIFTDVIARPALKQPTNQLSSLALLNQFFRSHPMIVSFLQHKERFEGFLVARSVTGRFISATSNLTRMIKAARKPHLTQRPHAQDVVACKEEDIQLEFVKEEIKQLSEKESFAIDSDLFHRDERYCFGASEH